MLKFVVLNCRMHICDMFNKMYVMASRGLVKSLFNYLHLYGFFYVTFNF